MHKLTQLIELIKSLYPFALLTPWARDRIVAGMKTVAKLFKSLSEETRLRILLLLREHGELCICDLMAALELPQSTISRHVAYLKNAGWLQDRRGGVWMYYSLAPVLAKEPSELLTLVCSSCASLPVAERDRLRLQQYAAEKNCI